MSDKILTTIPFSGFYESHHDHALDHALERECENYHTCELNEKLLGHAMGAINWGDLHEGYARLYVENFSDEFDIPSMEFESLESPREYNFGTDRIFVYISKDDFGKIWKGLSPEFLNEICKQRFTHRSGFISFYSPDWKDWGSFSKWDHNQFGTVIEAYVSQESSRYIPKKSNPNFPNCFNDFELVEDLDSNGYLSDLLYSQPALSRILNIQHYLNNRYERAA